MEVTFNLGGGMSLLADYKSAEVFVTDSGIDYWIRWEDGSPSEQRYVRDLARGNSAFALMPDFVKEKFLAIVSEEEEGESLSFT